MECIINTTDLSDSKSNKNYPAANPSTIHVKYSLSLDTNPDICHYKDEKSGKYLAKNNNLHYENVNKNGLHKFITDESDKIQMGEIKKPRRLLSVETLAKISVWYFFSFLALFLSKHVLDFHSVDLLLFTGIQLVVSTFLSSLNKQFNSRASKENTAITHQFLFSMALIGLMRAIVIYMGLLSIKHVALSFMETVKSSAPLFTLIISFFVLREKSGFLVQMSIIPIMLGLTLCTVFEVSFNWVGFTAALIANLAECLQFVLSKVYLGGNYHKIDPSDFQFYSSIAGLLTIFPLSPYLCDLDSLLYNTTLVSLSFMVIVGVSYYLQTLMAWYLMEFLSAVTHSICNTIKCGMAVWLSIVMFGNEVTLWSGVGSSMVIAGVSLYQKARSVEKEMRLVLRGRGGEVGVVDYVGGFNQDGLDKNTAERLQFVSDAIENNILERANGVTTSSSAPLSSLIHSGGKPVCKSITMATSCISLSACEA